MKWLERELYILSRIGKDSGMENRVLEDNFWMGAKWDVLEIGKTSGLKCILVEMLKYRNNNIIMVAVGNRYMEEGVGS